jgi:hypothetical protein
MVETTPLPIACTLTGASLEERATWLGRLGKAGLIEGVREGDQLRLRFRAEVGDDVRALVRAENECCPFLLFHLESGAAEVALAVTGPSEAGPVLDAMLAALYGSGRSTRI